MRVGKIGVIVSIAALLCASLLVAQDNELESWALLPLWMEGGEYSSMLTVNNTRDYRFPIILDLRGPDGLPVGSGQIILAPRESRQLKLADFLDQPGHSMVEGALWLRHSGHAQDVGMQITVHTPKGTFDVPPSEPVQFDSTRLRTLVDARGGQLSVLAVNGVELLHEVSVRISSRFDVIYEEAARLAANETLEIDLRPGELRGGDILLVEVQSDGEPGDVSGGVRLRQPNGQMEYHPFRDPESRQSSRLSSTAIFGAGFPGFRHPLLLLNTSENSIRVELSAKWRDKVGLCRQFPRAASLAWRGCSHRHC